MSLDFEKVTYVDGETVIGADNLNDIQDAILDLDSNKVEKEQGKGLSTEDYTSTEKTKLSGIEAGAQVNPGRATPNSDGLMSSSDKEKLDGIAQGATAVTVDATLSVAGNAADAKATGDSISAINAKIPAAASSVNKLMDAAAVNSAIATAISGVTSFSYEVVQTLPAGGAAGTIYLVAQSVGETQNIYDEYIWITDTWEKLGTKQIDLTPYRTASAQDTIDAGKQAKITASGILKGDGNGGVTAAEAGTDYGTYSKPSAGIPKTDLAYDVRTSLGKADTALQQHQSLAAYRTAAAQDEIDKAQDEEISDLKNAINDPNIGLHNKAPAIINTASGLIASFSDGADGMPLKKLTVNIEPVQAGTGDPSQENVRPISGWMAAKIYSAGKNLFNPDINLWETYITENDYAQWRMKYPTGIPVTISVNSYNVNTGGISIINNVHPVNTSASFGIRLGNNAWGNNKTGKLNDNGYLYVGTISGLVELREQMAQNEVQLEIGSEKTSYEHYQGNTYDITFPTEAGTVYGGTLTINDDGTCELRKRPYYASYNGETLIGPWLSSMDVYAEDTTPTIGAQVVDLGGEETVYQLTDQQILNTRYGFNNIWADCGGVEVEYRADTEMVVVGETEKNANEINATRAMLAPVEHGPTASQRYTVGDMLVFNGQLCKATAIIPVGDTLAIGTNVVVTTVATVATELNQHSVDVKNSEVIDGRFVLRDGTDVQSSAYCCTDFINISGYSGFDITFYTSIVGSYTAAVITDVNKNALWFVDGKNISDYGKTVAQEMQPFTVEIPSGGYYLRLTAYKQYYTDISDWGIVIHAKEDYFEQIDELRAFDKTVESKFPYIDTRYGNKKVLIIGDSISTDYYGNYKKWVTDLCDEGFFDTSKVTNSSFHATGFVADYVEGSSHSGTFLERLSAITDKSTYDLVITFGGINDYINQTVTWEAFTNAVDSYFDYLIKNFTQARLCVLQPLRTYNTNPNTLTGKKQQEYSAYIRTVAKNYCLPVLNLTEDSGFCPFVNEFNEMWTLIPAGYSSNDGVHPNEEYERTYLAPMIKGFLLSL